MCHLLAMNQEMSLHIFPSDPNLVSDKSPCLQGTEGLPCEFSSEPGSHAARRLLLEPPRPEHLDSETSSPGHLGTPGRCCWEPAGSPPRMPCSTFLSPAEGEAEGFLAPFTDVVLIFIRTTKPASLVCTIYHYSL